jgi:hypothetical protein
VAPEGGEGARTISLEIFGNLSPEPDLEADFAPYLSAAVLDDLDLELAAPGHGDLVLRGTVLDFRRKNGIRSRDNQLLEGSVRIEVSAELVRRSDGLVLKSAQTGLWAEYATGTPALTTPGVGEEPARARLFKNLADRLVLELFDGTPQ